MKTVGSRLYLACIVCVLSFFGCLGRERISSYPFISGDTFRAIANHVIDDTQQRFVPEKVKPRDIIFLKGDYQADFFKRLHPQITSPYILITHNSDFSPIFLTDYNHPSRGYNFEPYLNDPRIIVWFSQSIDIEHPKLKAIPLGIANNHWEHGDINMFKKALSTPLPSLEKRLPHVYVNFTVATNPPERQPALTQSKKRSYCDIKTRKSPRNYLEEIKQYRYVLSPPGNCLDCHRAWEALLMGCIPIMKHTLIDSLFDDLPVIFVDEWSDITEAFLERKYQEILFTSHNYEKMYADYWIRIIKQYQQGSEVKPY